MSAINFRYILITAAKNEALHIEKTIKSVIIQTVLPIKWVIVNDGSTDETEQIIKKYLDKYPWIDLISLPASGLRHFGRKAIAFRIGYEHIKSINFDFIGNLDADISFENDYFAFLLQKLDENPELGVVGTPFREGNRQYDYRYTNIEHVSGACQLFRRACYESIGGYKPLKYGGIDLYAVINARMLGWKTRSFPEKYCIHHRKMGTANRGPISVAFFGGYHDYLMGVSLIWQLFRSIYKIKDPPFMIFGIFLLLGYIWGYIARPQRLVTQEMLIFRKQEELSRIKAFLKELLD